MDDETVLYDARQGFILSEASVVDVGYVECHAVSDTTVASLAFIVQVNRKSHRSGHAPPPPPPPTHLFFFLLRLLRGLTQQ